jgi:hypothetical protein
MRKKLLFFCIAFAILLCATTPRANPGFSDPWNYDERRGLPLGPTASTFKLSQLVRLLGDHYPELTDPLLARHDEEATVRLLESYSRRYPVFLKDTQVMMPVADGVHTRQDPEIDHTMVDPSVHCDPNLFLCESICFPGEDFQPYDIVIVAGWVVEVAGETHTEGRSLVILADRFHAHGHKIVTVPQTYRGSRPERTQVGENQYKAEGGRNAGDGGHLILFANILEGIHADTSGQNGEAGVDGQAADGTIEAVVEGNNSPSPRVHCEGVVHVEAEYGGDGGTGGDAGSIVVRYTTLIGKGKPREEDKTDPVSDWQCYSNPDLGCGSFRCNQNPSIVICDVITEADNAQCSDGIDNDADGYVDCDDFSCSKNPFVTVCAEKAVREPLLREASPEACSDGIDNDRDGLVDCDDPGCDLREICGGSPGSPLVITTGLEESSTEACGNGRDDDLDGKTDCQDPECAKNPFVEVCGIERTLENCTDGVDNDSDGKIDCDDPGCRDNPYVHLCEPHRHRFLLESSASTCSDGIDNDQDGFTDCIDYQCQNNPLASDVCGDYENTHLECSDGIDNNGNGLMDCQDPTCLYNPFYGEFICGQGYPHRRIVKTGHTQLRRIPYPYNGVYQGSDASLIAEKGQGGERGAAGQVLSKSVRVTVNITPCEYYDEPCVYSKTVTCHLGKPTYPGQEGKDGQDGATSLLWVARRRIDSLRSLLSPRQWVVDTTNGNVFFKRGSWNTAAFTYLENIMRIEGILAEMGIDCETDPSTLDYPRMHLVTTLCPTLKRNQIKLTYIHSGLNFFGLPRGPQINPRERYQALRSQFDGLFSALDSSIRNWINLSNSLDISMLATFSIEALEREVSELEHEETIADQRVLIATQELEAIRTSVTNREAVLETIEDRVEVLDDRIAEKYRDKSFWDFLSDLGEGVLKTLGKEILSGTAGKVWDKISDELGNAFDVETGTGDTGEGWEFFEEVVTDAFESSAVKKEAKDRLGDLGSYLWKALNGESVPRSGLDPEIERLVISQTQVNLTLEYIDLLLALRKAEAELELAKMERQLVRIRQANARTLANHIRDYVNVGAELSVFDKTLLGRQAYESAIQLIDKLTRLYAKILRQAEYESLTFSPETGGSLIPLITTENLDFNLRNYLDMAVRLTELDESISTFTGSRRYHYHRWVGEAFVSASEADRARLATLGFTETTLPSVRVLKVKLDHDDLLADPVLGTMRKRRIRDIRLRILTETAGDPITAYVARDTFDSFLIGRPDDTTEWVVDFELVPKDLNPDGTVKSPLHYQSFEACVAGAPSCDLSDDACRTVFQDSPFHDSCSVSPGADLPETMTFYDRSLVGEWFFAISEAVLADIGPVMGVEVIFEVAAEDL